MLKHEPKARLVKWNRYGLGDKLDGYFFLVGESPKEASYRLKMDGTAFKQLKSDGKKAPVEIAKVQKRVGSATRDEWRSCKSEGEYWWLYKDRFYKATDKLTADDVFALITEEENRKRLKLQKAHALVSMRRELDPKAKRQPIPQDIKVQVWQRDGGRCVECSSQANLEFDHIIPLAMGGSNGFRNIQLLCDDCNRRKGASLG